MTFKVPTRMISSVLTVLVYIVLLVPGQKYSKEYILAEAFVPTCHYQPPRSAAITTSSSTSAYGRKKRKTVSSSSLLWYAESPEDSLLSEMKSPDMKMELESYGISTKSMFDKKEFETALQEARRRKGGLEDKRKTKVTTTTSTSSATTNKKDLKQEVATTSSDSSTEKRKNKNKTREKKKSSIWKDIASAAKEVLDSNAKKFSDSVSSSSTKEKSSSFSTATSNSNNNNSKKNTRQQRYELALKEGAAMKISQLKNELTGRGISTVSYFEKSDLIDAYANAIADKNSVSNDKTSSPTNNKGTTTNTDRRSSSNDAIFDPSFKNVIMSSFDPSTMILPGEVVIDITAA